MSSFDKQVNEIISSYAMCHNERVCVRDVTIGDQENSLVTDLGWPQSASS